MSKVQTLLGQPNSALLLGDNTWLPGSQALLLHSPEQVLASDDPLRVLHILEQVESELRRGRFVMLCLSYELSTAFDLSAHQPAGAAPAAWMASYAADNVLSMSRSELWPLVAAPDLDGLQVELNVLPEEYKASIAVIKDLIASGDTYQVNYTCHARFSLSADPLGYFLALARSHPVPYAAYVDMGEAQILSLSPELLLRRRGDTLESRPMKGTRRRGRTLEEDRGLAGELVASEKDRAENVMILDMMRNDLGRICRMGTVTVPEMFVAEKYRSVWQMTSAAVGEALPELSINDVMAAVFPGSSITGAPKRRTMEIIRDLEGEARGLYTGAIGLFTPDGDFTCNLPIRTLVHRAGQWDLGIGSGIVWDSDPQAEYEETLLKSQFAFSMLPDLRLFETMLVTERGEILFEEEHLRRMARSAEYWDLPFDRDRVRDELMEFVQSLQGFPVVLRMELDQDGAIQLTPRQAPQPPASPVRVALSMRSTNSQDRFLFHKTNRRKLYEQGLEWARAHDFFEIIFRNEDGHLTEGAITNLFVRIGTDWSTPPVEDGLLPGVWRESFVREVRAAERSISVDDLSGADEIVIGNSVRGAIAVGEIWEDGRCVYGRSVNKPRTP